MTEDRRAETPDAPVEETAAPGAEADTEPGGTAAPPEADVEPGETSRGAGSASGEEHAPEADALEAETVEDDLTAAQRAVTELTADLQRLQAEYLNYKRRVDRDRELISQNATFKVLSPIIEVLDTIDRAREHGEVEGGFKAVADQLERIVSNLGLTRFGEPGEPFDPTIHEALSHMGTDPDVKETTVKVLAKAGYRIGDRVVRAAQVLVVDPE
ncbi:nucleotide exchange factor GrpE [Nocardioides cheoyonin]|uniref:nucleotide exchange factor GrpE n=1 Tax=Nocardioides cheoyonin TaxID=3156615 RepID=UPI0032B5C9A3